MANLSAVLYKLHCLKCHFIFLTHQLGKRCPICGSETRMWKRFPREVESVKK